MLPERKAGRKSGLLRFIVISLVFSSLVGWTNASYPVEHFDVNPSAEPKSQEDIRPVTRSEVPMSEVTVSEVTMSGENVSEEQMSERNMSTVTMPVIISKRNTSTMPEVEPAHKTLLDKVLFDSTVTTVISTHHPCHSDKWLYAVIVTTGATCFLLGMLGSYLLFRRETNLIIKSLSLKTQATKPVRRQSSCLSRAGLSDSESTTSSILVKMMKGMKVADHQSKENYEKEMKCGKSMKI